MKKVMCVLVLLCFVFMGYAKIGISVPVEYGAASADEVKPADLRANAPVSMPVKPIDRIRLPVKPVKPITVQPAPVRPVATVETECGRCSFTDPNIRCVSLEKNQVRYLGGYYMEVRGTEDYPVLWYNRLVDYLHDLYTSHGPSNYLSFSSYHTSDVINPGSANCPTIDVYYCGVDPSDPERFYFGMRFYDGEYFPYLIFPLKMESSVQPITDDLPVPIKYLYCKAPDENLTLNFSWRAVDVDDLMDVGDYTFYFSKYGEYTHEYTGSLVSNRVERLSIPVSDGSYIWRLEINHDGFTEYYPHGSVAVGEMAMGNYGILEVRSHPKVVVTPEPGTILHPGDTIHVEISNASTFDVIYFSSPSHSQRIEEPLAHPSFTYTYDFEVTEEDLNYGRHIRIYIRAERDSHTVGLPACEFYEVYDYKPPYEISADLKREIDPRTVGDAVRANYVCDVRVMDDCDSCYSDVITKMYVDFVRRENDDDLPSETVLLGEWNDHVIGSGEFSHQIPESTVMSVLSSHGVDPDDYRITVRCEVEGREYRGYQDYTMRSLPYGSSDILPPEPEPSDSHGPSE